MAARYAVATGNWNWTSSDTSHWAATSGGSPGVSVPGVSDDVIFDGNSGNFVVTITGFNPQSSSYTFTGFTGTLTGLASANFQVANGVANVTLGSGMTITNIGLVYNTNAIGTLTTNGVTIPNLAIGSTTGTGVCTFGDAVTVINTVTFGSGTLNTNGKTCSWGQFSSSNSNTRTLTLGSSSITITFTATTVFDIGTATGLTIATNTATIICTGASPGVNIGGKNMNGMSLVYQLCTSPVLTANNGTLAAFTYNGPASKTGTLKLQTAGVTITGTCTFNGNSSINRIIVSSDVVGSARTITAGSLSCTNVINFQDITGAGAATWTVAGSGATWFGDCQGNSGITLSTSVLQTWNGTVGGNWSTNTWTTRVPLPQDDVVIDSAFSASQTIVADMPQLGRSIDFTGSTGSPKCDFSSINVQVFGNLTFIAGMTISTGAHFIFAGRGSQTITSAGQGWGFDVDIIAPGGTYTLQDNFTGNAELELGAGTFNANGHNVTISDFNTQGATTVTRVLNPGSGTWTLTGASQTVWSTTPGTNFSIVSNTATVICSGGNAVFSSALAVNLNGLSLSMTGGGNMQINGQNTFANLTITGTASMSGNVSFSSPQTVIGALTIAGNSTSNRIFLQSQTIGTAITFTCTNAPTLSNVDFMDITAAGTGGTWAGTSIGDCLGNTNITTTPGVTRYGVVAGNFSSTATWSTTSGGSGGSSVPLPQDTIILDANSAAGTYTADMPRMCKDIVCTGFTRTLNTTVGNTSFGNVTFGSGMTRAGGGAWTLSGRGSQTLTGAGVSAWRGSINITAPGGTYTLQDDMIAVGTQILTLNNGGFNANNHNVTIGALVSSNTNVRSLTMGSGTWTLSQPDFILTLTTTTNLTFSAGTSVINLVDTSSTSKIFSGGGLSYGTLQFKATGTANLTIQSPSPTFINLDVEATSAKTLFITGNGITVTGTLTLAGGSLTNLLSVVSATPGTQATIGLGTTGVVAQATCLSLTDSAITGTNTPAITGGSTNVSNNTGWTFATYPVAAGGNTSATTTWNTGVVPIATTPVAFVSGSGNVTNDGALIAASYNFTGYTGTLTLTGGQTMEATGSAANITLSSGMTLAGTGVIAFNTGAIGTLITHGISIPNLTIGFSSSTIGVVTLGDTNTVAGVVNLSGGTLNTNNQTCTWGSFSSSNSNTRTLTLGSSAITLTGTSTVSNVSSTNLTVTANTSVWTFTGASPGIVPPVNMQGGSIVITGGGSIDFYGATMANLTITGTANKTDNIRVNANVTITGTFTASGNSTTNRLFIHSGSGSGVDAPGTSKTITAAIVSVLNVDFMDISAIGASSTISPTLSGNEITDAHRIAALGWATSQLGGSTDGLPNLSGTGIWEAGTNLFGYGQCDALGSGGSNGWVANATGTTRTTDATTPAPFSPQSIKVVCDGSIINQGIDAETAIGLAAAPGVVASGSIYFKGTAGVTYTTRLYWSNTDATLTGGTQANVVATGSWQLLTLGNTTVGAGKTGDKLFIIIAPPSVTANTFWVAHAMIQTGVTVGSPYIATSGGTTASRNAGRVQASSSLLNTTQGWVAIRLNLEWASTNTNNAFCFSFDDGTTNNRIQLFWNGISARWETRRVTGGNAGNPAFVSDSFSAGASRTLIMSWDSNNVYISLAGASFISAVNGQTFVASGLNFGADYGGGAQIDSNIVWAAIGTGTLTNANAVTINNFGNYAPSLASLPGTPTGVWNGAMWTGTSIGDALGNSGINTDPPIPQAWQGTTGGNWSTLAKWTSRVPLPQDDVTINNAFAATQIVTADMPRLGRSINWTGSTGTPTWNISVATSNFGNLTLISGMTLSGSNSFTFSGRGAQTITSAGRVFSGALFVSAPGGSYVPQDALNTNGGSFTLTAGTFDCSTTNVAITCSGFLSGSTNTRTLKMGNGLWTMFGTGAFTLWSLAVSGLTFLAGSSTIAFTATDSATKIFAGGGLTYGTFQYKSTGSGGLTFTGNNTFANLDLECTTARTITLPVSGLQIITNSLTLNGASGQVLTLVSSSPGTSTSLQINNGASDNINSFVTLSSDVYQTMIRSGGGKPREFGGGPEQKCENHSGGMKPRPLGGSPEIKKIVESGGSINHTKTGGGEKVIVTATGGSIIKTRGGGSHTRSGGARIKYKSGGSEILTIKKSGGSITKELGGGIGIATLVHTGGAIENPSGQGVKFVTASMSGGGIIHKNGGATFIESFASGDEEVLLSSSIHQPTLTRTKVKAT